MRPSAGASVAALASVGGWAAEGEGESVGGAAEVNGEKGILVRVLFDYEGTTETELDLRADDIVSRNFVFFSRV